MAERVKVRLVRCPKCDNVLPEHPDYDVYQCGVCGTVLRAKEKMLGTDGLSEKSDEERVVEKFESSDGFAGKDVVSDVDRGVDIESGDGIDHDSIEETVFKEGVVNSTASSPSRTPKKSALMVNYRKKESEMVDMQFNQFRANNDAVSDNRLGESSKRPIGNWVHKDAEGVNLDRSKFNYLRVEKETLELIHQNENLAGSSRQRELKYQREAERDDRDGPYWNSRSGVERGNLSYLGYPNEEHSNYHPGYVNDYEMMKSNDHVEGGFKRVEKLENDRAELLRKLNEMDDQLRRSGGVADIPKEMLYADRRVPSDPYGGRDIYVRSSKDTFQSNTVTRPPYFNGSRGHASSVNKHDIDMRNFYSPPRHGPIHIPGYEISVRPQTFRRPPKPSSRQYPSQSSYNNTSGWYSDTSQDPLRPRPREASLHHPSCSCLHCNYRIRQAPPQEAHSVSSNGRLHENSTFPSLYHDVKPVNYGPRYNPRGVNTPQLYSQYPRPHGVSQSDLDSDFGGTRPYRPRTRRVVVSFGKRRLYHPLAGGAPFITCYNCSELLKVPRKIMLMDKKMRKLQCGACATLISFEAESKGLIVSKPTYTEQIPAENDEVFGKASNNNLPDIHADSPYIFQSTPETSLQSNDQRLNVNDSEIRQGLQYSSLISSEEKESPESVIIHNEVSTHEELSSKDYGSPPRPVAPASEISSNHAASRYRKVNEGKTISQENDFLKNSTSAEVSKKDHIHKPNKGNRSFFGSLIKKSFRDSSRSGQVVDNVRSSVSINGKPITHRAVQKAEMLAGTIQPGDYWYDYRAGFWGVMGQPCHGIIPPFIEEFDYPMPRRCGAGNTGVSVNGRELHQKDLDLLVRRGLPTTSNKSYIIEISGKVMDEHSGKELHDLGNLAPTVERTRHGFGMRVPQVAM